MSLYELKECDVISTVYTAYPSYILSMSLQSGVAESEVYYIFSSSQGLSRDYFDINDEPVTGSVFNVSGNVKFLFASRTTSGEKRALERLRNTYENRAFKKPENYSSASVYSDAIYNMDNFYVLNIPAVFYGSEIKPHSFKLELPVVGESYIDDGLGGLYDESSPDVLVGSIFYQHGIVFLSTNAFPNTPVTASFSGTNKIPVNIYNCTVKRGESNFTTNPSYTSYISGSNRNETTTTQPKTFITSVQLYDENYKVVGVAKVATPIKNEEATGLVFKLKLNF